MANTVTVKRSNVAGKAPLPADLEIGELAVNFPDKQVYTKEPAGTVIALISKPPMTAGLWVWDGAGAAWINIENYIVGDPR